MNSGWFLNLRAALELSYFVAGIVIAFFAAFALQQIALTKKIAAANAKRESLRFAAERRQYYAETCVVLQTRVVNEHTRLGLSFLNHPQFSIVDGGVLPQNLNQGMLAQQYAKMPNDIVTCLNSIEAFAIPFAAGVADDEVGFQETAGTFCQIVEQLIGMVIILRTTGARYESTIKVYDRWKSRLVAQDLEGKMKRMQEQHREMAAKGKIKRADPY